MGVCIMKGGPEGISSFFCSRDIGESFRFGFPPSNLVRRMNDAGLSPEEQFQKQLVYLATGPRESYYAEFRSGHSWWCLAHRDEDFDAILREWKVYRVVFGPTLTAAAAATTSSLRTSSKREGDKEK